MTVVATRTAPRISCPSWCIRTPAEHIADLDNLEGFVVHISADAEVGGVTLHARPAGRPGR